jgi:tRNA-Thr(GGU) m(6)t(6)A37 methyltransferase TsaA
MKKLSVNLNIIGIIHSPYKIIDSAPFQGKDEIVEIEIDKEYIQGLKDIEGFSYLHIFYWLHKSSNFSLVVQTPWDTTPHGVFTTRSPHRPNPLGHAVVKFVKQKNNVIIVKGMDAIDGTPVIDIKPYIKDLDVKSKVFSGWMEKKF